MDKRYLLTMAAAAAMFAACSDDAKELSAPELATNPTEVAQQQDIPVLFDSYVNRATTRAGDPGTLITTGTAAGQIDLETKGFGVFAYYTDNNEYDQLYTPNFMYNEKVSTSSWTYSPVRYWPNEFGSNALSDDADKVSFFAYAPWVEVTPANGKVINSNENTWGITGLSKNSATGDPVVKYISSFEAAHSVDLCWGVVADDATGWAKTGTTQTMTAGKPWLNVERPADATGTQKMKFNFLHALSQLQVQVDAYVDGLDNMKDVTDNTKIMVRSISFTGIATKGALNLNNTESKKAMWLSYNGTDELESGETFTVYDGLKDGKEGTLQEASNEKSLGLADQFIGTGAGVTKTLADLFDVGTVLVIPTGEPMTVTITYDVETADDKLAGYLSDGVTHGTSVQNVISKEISFGTTNYLENGKKYVLKLHLGMNSVKFDAAVTDWANPAIERDVELPFNAISFASGTNGKISIPGTETSTVFYITGQDKSDAATKSVTAGDLTGLTATLDDTDRATKGYTKVTADDFAANGVTTKKVGSVTVTDAASAASTIEITQAGVIGFTTIIQASEVLTLTWSATDVTTTNEMATAGSVQVYKNGTLQTITTHYTLAEAKTISLVGPANIGDVIKVVLQANDAPAEEQTFVLTAPVAAP